MLQCAASIIEVTSVINILCGRREEGVSLSNLPSLHLHWYSCNWNDNDNYHSTQWAAVRTWVSEIRAPPQNWPFGPRPLGPTWSLSSQGKMKNYSLLIIICQNPFNQFPFSEVSLLWTEGIWFFKRNDGKKPKQPSKATHQGLQDVLQQCADPDPPSHFFRILRCFIEDQIFYLLGKGSKTFH